MIAEQPRSVKKKLLLKEVERTMFHVKHWFIEFKADVINLLTSLSNLDYDALIGKYWKW